MIETHPISNFVRDIVHTRRAVASGRAPVEDADEVYVAYFDTVMVRFLSRLARGKRKCPSCRK